MKSTVNFERNNKLILFRPKKINCFLHTLIIPTRLLGSGFINHFETNIDPSYMELGLIQQFNLTSGSKVIINNKKVDFKDIENYYSKTNLYKILSLEYLIRPDKKKVFINKLRLEKT